MSTPDDKLSNVDKESLEKGPAASDGASEGGESDDPYAGKITVDVGHEIAQKARAAVFRTPGLRLYDLAKEGLRRVIAEIEERRGEPLPVENRKLKGGRPTTMERENIIDWLSE